MSKRAAPGSSLVGYPDSDDDSDKKPTVPLSKKRKLPALAPQLSVPVPVDDPAKHQGRLRSSPHVDGQWAAHVYISIPLSSNDHQHLNNTLKRACTLAKERVPTLQKLLPSDQAELHVSLTRPVFLRAHQRQELKQAVKLAARARHPFTASFATFAELINDEQTRTFLCLEIGAGHHEIRALSDALSPTLRAFRQKDYYDAPRFHASFAWALLDRSSPPAHAPADSTTPSCNKGSPTRPRCSPTDRPSLSSAKDITEERSYELSDIAPEISTALPAGVSDSHEGQHPPADFHTTSLPADPLVFPTIPHFPPALVPELNQTLGNQLLERAAVFDVAEVCVRIGKEVSKWSLGG